MRVGLVTPVVVQIPGSAAGWEAAAGPRDLIRVAQAAERLGYAHLTCSEHVAVPSEVAEQRGLVYWDPLATLSFLAAHTSRIGLTTNVLVLGYHHPLALAKRYGTLDLLSGGRLILGVGVGTLRQEFDLLGAPFEDRGDRADDALRALRAALSVRVPAYEGRYFGFSCLVVDPCATQDHVPIWVGGRTGRSLHRAVSLADGWMPTALSADQCRQMLGRHELPDGFEVVLGPGRPLDPLSDPGKAGAALERLTDAGATTINASFSSRSPDHYVEQMEALMTLVRP